MVKGITKPITVNILGKIYTIIYCDNPAEVDAEKRSSLWGQVDYWTRTIRIYDNGRQPSDLWETLIHEVLHALGSELHLESLDKGKTEDKQKHEDLDILSVGLADTFIRNGWLQIEGK